MLFIRMLYTIRKMKFISLIFLFSLPLISISQSSIPFFEIMKIGDTLFVDENSRAHSTQSTTEIIIIKLGQSNFKGKIETNIWIPNKPIKKIIEIENLSNEDIEKIILFEEELIKYKKSEINDICTRTAIYTIKLKEEERVVAISCCSCSIVKSFHNLTDELK